MTHELLMSKKCKTKLRMMITVVGLMMMVMMMMMIMKMMVILKLKMMTMMIMMMIVVIMLTMNVGNIVDGVTANGDVSNIKHLIGKAQWCFLKPKTLQLSEEITFACCTTTSEQNDCTVLYETSVLWTLDLKTFNRISTQFTEIHVGRTILQTWQCTCNLHTLTMWRDKVGSWKNILRWFLQTDL